MVVSITCMTVANMVETATRTLLPRRPEISLGVSMSAHADEGEHSCEWPWHRIRVPGIDIDIDAHPSAKKLGVARILEHETHRHALHHLDPVAGRVLSGKQREFRTGARADT